MWENTVIINIKIRKTKSFAISVRVVTVLKLPTYGNHASIHSNLYMCTLKFWHLKVICNFNFSCPTFIYLISIYIYSCTYWVKMVAKEVLFHFFFCRNWRGDKHGHFLYPPLCQRREKVYKFWSRWPFKAYECGILTDTPPSPSSCLCSCWMPSYILKLYWMWSKLKNQKQRSCKKRATRSNYSCKQIIFSSILYVRKTTKN